MIKISDLKVGSIIVSDHFMESYRWMKVTSVVDDIVLLESKGVIRDCGDHSEWVRIKIRKIKISELV